MSIIEAIVRRSLVIAGRAYPVRDVYAQVFTTPVERMTLLCEMQSIDDAQAVSQCLNTPLSIVVQSGNTKTHYGAFNAKSAAIEADDFDATRPRVCFEIDRFVYE